MLELQLLKEVFGTNLVSNISTKALKSTINLVLCGSSTYKVQFQGIF